MKPDFIDNLDGNTMAAALCAHLDWLESTRKPGDAAVEISIASGYFNIEGFALLAERLEKLGRVRLLLGAEPLPPPAWPRRSPGDPRGAKFDERVIRRSIEKNYDAMLLDRDLLDFAPRTDAAIKRLLALLETGRVEVKRYEKAFLHGKAYLFGGATLYGSSDADGGGTIVGSSNLTAGGLTKNLEVNLGRYDADAVGKVGHWFGRVWADAVPFDLAAIYRARFAEFSPYLIYLRVLWELYGAELAAEAAEVSQSRIRLTTFQNDGVWRAQRIMDEYNGVLVADGVGLGKSFIAGELMRRAVEDRRQRVLLVAPAALRDGMWQRFEAEHQFYFECISFEQLAQGTAALRFHPREYAMVVVDESQAVRNPVTMRAQALRRLLQDKPPKKLLLLSATPVNNSLWDLYYLITLFAGHDGVFADRGIRSLRQRFSEASAQNPNDLRPDVLFDVLDSVTVRRTRHFVKKYYPNDKIIGPGGREIVVQFPKPYVHREDYSLEGVLPGFIDELEEAIAPQDEHQRPLLTMARYVPSAYRRDGDADASQVALAGLVGSGLLKRFESSVHAFAKTAAKMVRGHDAFLAALAQGRLLTPEALESWSGAENDEDWEAILDDAGAPAADPKAYDLGKLRAAVESDREILDGFAKRAATLKAAKDPKLTKLLDVLRKVLAAAKKDGIGPDDTRNKRKVLIFSYFADTAIWIHEFLKTEIAKDKSLSAYQDRLAMVAGHSGHDGVTREDAVFGFAPTSTQAPPAKSEDRFDILVTTDVLSEGVNLQQCRNIINYDLPWNPMRLVQRHGRVDRIGSPHRSVNLHCYFPDERLNALLALVERIHHKVAQAAATIGVEAEIIPGSRTQDLAFSETREQIERLRAEDPSIFDTGGEDPNAHSGEEYRQELRRALQTSVLANSVKTLPGSAGSGLIQGTRKGHFFCARVGERLYLRFVPLDHTATIERNTLRCLKAITCTETTPRHLPAELATSAYHAWARARRDIYADWTFATDPLNIQPKIRPLFRRAADHLRAHPPTGIEQMTLDQTVDAIEAPWGVRHERALREAFDVAGGPIAISKALIDKVSELGLQPFVQPSPLPLIEESEITLVCWMAVDAKAP